MKLLERKTDDEYVESVRRRIRLGKWQLPLGIGLSVVCCGMLAGCLLLLHSAREGLGEAHRAAFDLGFLLGQVGLGFVMLAAAPLVKTVQCFLGGNRTARLLVKYYDAAKQASQGGEPRDSSEAQQGPAGPGVDD